MGQDSKVTAIQEERMGGDVGLVSLCLLKKEKKKKRGLHTVTKGPTKAEKKKKQLNWVVSSELGGGEECGGGGPDYSVGRRLKPTTETNASFLRGPTDFPTEWLAG